MAEKFASLLTVTKIYDSGEIRFYDDPDKFGNDLKKIVFTPNQELKAKISFNGELSCEEVLTEFQEYLPYSRFIKNDDYISLKVPPQYVHDLNKKFIQYFIGNAQKKRERPTEEEAMNMTVGEYYERFLKNR